MQVEINAVKKSHRFKVDMIFLDKGVSSSHHKAITIFEDMIEAAKNVFFKKIQFGFSSSLKAPLTLHHVVRLAPDIYAIMVAHKTAV